MLQFRHWFGLLVLATCYSIQASSQCASPLALWQNGLTGSNYITINWLPDNSADHYQIRYWELSSPGNKTILAAHISPPFTLTGLRKSTTYSIQVRSVCGSTYSDWSTTINSYTSQSSNYCGNPTGIQLSSAPGSIHINWTSSGSHTIRYRDGYTGDWIIPADALSIDNTTYSINGLAEGIYQVEIKQNCSTTSSYYRHFIIQVDAVACIKPEAPIVQPGITDALITLPDTNGVLGYTIQFRAGMMANWETVGINVPPSVTHLNPPLTPATLYQVRIQAVCIAGTSEFSEPSTFNTESAPVASCLADKDFGKNLDQSALAQISADYNKPSPYTLGSTIGVNDGGLTFRSFQFSGSNPITELTTQLRNFHTMDEDFDNSLTNYDENTKPKETVPEGTPAHISRNQNFYDTYCNTHGFMQITGAVELLQYSPQSWKDKMYKESDWSLLGPIGIRTSFGNYTKTFIDAMAPAGGADNEMLVSNFQVGNELWDYPEQTDYQQLLTGARDGFIDRYGEKSAGAWKMNLVVGAFQAFRDNNCQETLRNVSNCGGSLERHDFIGDYLDLLDCDVLKDLDAIDCHPYSFLPGTITWTYPENPTSDGMQIKNLAGWLNANRDSSSGILRQTRLWSTEYGFDSNPVTGVGERTHSAYLIRGLMMHNRYHYEKVFFYNAFDHSRVGDPYYNGLYNSAGFWKLGTHPANGSWASPIPAHGATAKPAWYGMKDLKTRFNDHVFYKSLVEDTEAFVYLMAKPDGTDPYLIFWSPQLTTDSNLDQDISINKTVSWSTILPDGYKVATESAQLFAEGPVGGSNYSAAVTMDCGTTILQKIRRNPAFIRLVSCTPCPNIISPGGIATPNPNIGDSPFDPPNIGSIAAAFGGTGAAIQYQWQVSNDNILFVDIPGAVNPAYDPPSLTQSSYFRRGAKRGQCADFIFTRSVAIIVNHYNACPVLISFNRKPNNNPGCNIGSDNFYEIKLGNIYTDDAITIYGLPGNGINYTMSSLNGTAFTTSSFPANLEYVDLNTLKWHISSSNGSSQTLQLFYCWANGYADPSETEAIEDCSGLRWICSALEPEPLISIGDRSIGTAALFKGASQFQVSPNPGLDYIILSYSGSTVFQASLQVLSTTGQLVEHKSAGKLEDGDQWQISVSNLPAGLYLLRLETSSGVVYQRWIKG